MAKVELVENWAYYSLVGDLIRQAQTSIDLVTFDFLYQFKKPQSPTTNIAEKLIIAKQKGVRVKVLLNASPHYPHLKEIHSHLYDLLTKGLVDCKLWLAEETLHAKMLVIDRAEVVIGSHNISDSALTRNMEISVRVSNPQFGTKCAQSFDKLWCYDQVAERSEKRRE